MRITGETFHRPTTSSPASSGRLPRDLSAVWAAMAAGGATVLGLVGGPDDALVVVAGVGALSGGAFLLGRRVVREDARVEALRTDRDRLRLQVVQLTGELVLGRAEGALREDEPPAPAAARPSASVRGGGRPGRSGALAAVPTLDAPLDAADGATS